MRQSTFYIVINLKTSQGYECIGKFFIGDHRKSASGIFLQLKGSSTVNEKSIIQLDLMESKNGLPANLQMISCSLEELSENCRIITKELFRLLNMEQTSR
jgi:hypothetical protein